MFDVTIAGARRPTTNLIPIAAGTVACPRLGSVSIERCLECPYLLRIEADGGRGVRCISSTPRELS